MVVGLEMFLCETVGKGKLNMHFAKAFDVTYRSLRELNVGRRMFSGHPEF